MIRLPPKIYNCILIYQRHVCPTHVFNMTWLHIRNVLAIQLVRLDSILLDRSTMLKEFGKIRFVFDFMKRAVQVTFHTILLTSECKISQVYGSDSL